MTESGDVDPRVDRPRGEHGHLAEVYPPEDVLDAIGELPGTYVTAKEVAAHFECHPETMRRKMNDLVDAGKLVREKPHPKRSFYQLPADSEGETHE